MKREKKIKLILDSKKLPFTRKFDYTEISESLFTFISWDNFNKIYLILWWQNLIEMQRIAEDPIGTLYSLETQLKTTL